jgi:carbonic anhydrase/acetyltransferase-like protein (isoleucine patch superfamily)
MGAIILTGAEVGERCLLGAGALLPEGKKIPSGSVAMGMPARAVRQVTEEDLSRMKATNEAYRWLMRTYQH